MDIIKRLEEDHKKILQKVNQLPGLLIKAKKSIDPLLLLAGEIESDLNLHEKIEDDILFPALKEKVPEETLLSLVREHEESKKAREAFKTALSEISKAADNKDLAVIKEMSNHGYKLMRILSTHLSREDRLLFPLAKSFLTAEISAALEKQAQALASSS